MANLDFDDDEGPISLAHRRAALNLATSMGDDPEEMSRALQLSQSSGVPAPIISADLEGFEKEHRANLSNELVKRNEFLQAYLADETAAKLSYDDVGPLDQASESIGKLNEKSKLQQWLEATNPASVKKAIQESAAAPAARGLAEAFEEGYGPQPLGWAGVDRPEDLEWALSHPLAASVVTAAATPLEAMSRVTKGVINLGRSGTESIFGKQFADDMAGMIEYAITAPEVAAAHYQDPLRQAIDTTTKKIGLEPLGLTEADMVPRPAPERLRVFRDPLERQAANLELVEKHADKLRDLMHGQQVADIFHEAGEEPPPHIDPLIDKAKETQIREDLQRLKDAMRDSAATATRERSQDHFARFAELHGPGEIGIDSAEIRRIYGEKAPEEGDGLLGWIPDLGDRLARSEQYGGDVWVDRAQFLAKTEREVVNEIGDGLRLRDGGVTVNETKIGKDVGEPLKPSPDSWEYQVAKTQLLHEMEEENLRRFALGEAQVSKPVAESEIIERVNKLRPSVEPKQVIADELPALRGGAGMEPRAYNGDRKVTLRMRERAEAPRGWERTGATSMHDIEIVGDTGKPIGLINISVLEDGKLLHIDNIQAGPESTAFYEPNFLGYSAIKDIKRQLKEMFPQSEETTGYRATGARWAGGKVPPRGISAPRVSLDMAADPQEFRDMLSSLMQPGEAIRMHGAERDTTVAEHLGALYPREGLSPLTREIVDRLINLVGDTKFYVRHEIPPDREGGARSGFFNTIREDIHIKSDAPAWVAIHEAMHAATFKAIETNPTVRANIEALMDGVDLITDGAHEDASHPANYAMTNAHEFIAEAFSNRKLQRWMAEQEITPELRATLGLSERQKTLWQAFVSYIRKALGLSEGTETLLERVLSVGEEAFVKEPVKVGVERALQVREERAARELGMVEHPEDREVLPVEGAKAVGVPKGFLEREERLLKELQERDWKADQKRQAKQIRAQLLPEAKARGKEINKQVREEFEGRPDLAVDKFMSEGQVKFDPDHLTTEQKERLPKDYVAKGGMNPDDLAGTLGYTSGDAMVERLAMLTEDRKRSGLDQKAYFNKQLRTEVEKRLNAEFGPKRDEMLQEYRDHALSETQMQLTHVETIRKAVELGIKPQITLDEMKAMAKSVMDETPIGEIKSARYLQKSGAIAMKVAEAEQKGKHPEAYRLLQQKQLAQLVAKQAVEYERTRKSFDRMAGNFVKTPTAETAKRIDIPYYNWVQQALARVGYNIDVAALAERIKLEDHQTLNDFVAAKHAELREINVPQFVLDQTWPGSKTLKDLTYGEFKDLHDFVKTMEHEGRDEKMLVKGGEQIALDEAIDDLVNQAKDIKALPPETLKKDRQTPVRDVAKGVWWGHITPETMWDRLDRGNVRGLFHQLLIYPAARAVNAKLTMMREYGKRFNEIDFKDMDKVVENTLFRDPETGQLIEMRRRNMLRVLADWGNESNIKKLTEGWGVDRAAVEGWLRKNSRPEDWAEMQKIGGIFKDLMKEAQKMSRAVTGVPIKEIDIQPFTDPHGFSREGWYSPVDYEAERPKGKGATGANELERPGYYRATTDQRYAKQRTGKVAPTDLTLDIIPQRMAQMIHDITVRPTAIEMGKILHNEKFQGAINSVYGKAQMDEMRSWLQDMTNQTNVDVAGQKAMNQAAGFLRANIIGNLIGFNIGTVAKHGLTAGVNSILQAGPLNFLKATKELFQADSATGLKKAKLAYDESEELQGRMHNYADLLRGQGESFQFEQGTAAWLRELNLKLGTAPVAWADYLTTTPVYWAARNDALARGATLDMAIDIGNKAVRDTHGAARLTARPSVMRQTNEMAKMYSSLYGFFSHMLQQQYKLAWKARDILNGQKPLDIEGHWAPHMLGKFMSYAIIPALVEELVTPYTNEEKDSWGMKAAKGIGLGLSSSLPIVRDIVRSIINPHEEGGIFETAITAPSKVVQDLTGKPSRDRSAKLLKDTIALNGILTGTTNAPEGKAAAYILRYTQGLERPKGPWDVAVGLRYGKTDKHTHTFEEWWKHTVEGKR